MNSFRLSGAKNADSTGRAYEVDVQDAIAYAASVALKTKLFAAKTIFRIAQATGALSITIGVGDSTTPPMSGDEAEIWLSSDGTGRVVTFSTGFAPTGTLTMVASKKAVANFVFDGAAWIEKSRAIGA